MSQQVYPSSAAPAYVPRRITDTFTITALTPVQGSSAPNWIGNGVPFSHCNGVAGVTTGALTNFPSQHECTKKNWIARNNTGIMGNGTQVHVLKSGLYSVDASVCWNTPGLNNYRSVSIARFSKNGTLIGKYCCQSDYGHSTPTLSFTQGSSAIIPMEATEFLVFYVVGEANPEALADDRGCPTVMHITCLD